MPKQSWLESLRDLGGMFSNRLHRAGGWLISSIDLPRDPVPFKNLYDRYKIDISNVLILRSFGISLNNGILEWSRMRLILISLLYVSPTFLAVVDCVAGSVPDGGAGSYVSWIGYFGAISFATVAFSLGGVRVFHHLTPDLEDVLTGQGLTEYLRWADVATSRWLQGIFALIVASGGCIALRVAQSVPELSTSLYISPISFFAVFLAGLAISGGVYWILQGTVLSVLVTRPRMMTLLPYAPVATPGLDLLARCYRLAFYASCVGIALCLAPILSWAYEIRGSDLLTLMKFALFVLAILSVALVAVVPQWRLSRVVGDERRRVLQQLRLHLPEAPSSRSPSEHESFLLDWMQTVLSSRATTVSDAAISGLLLGLGTASLPFAIQLLRGN